MSEGRILVVEDDSDISNMLQLYFRSLEYEVHVAPLRRMEFLHVPTLTPIWGVSTILWPRR